MTKRFIPAHVHIFYVFYHNICKCFAVWGYDTIHAKRCVALIAGGSVSIRFFLFAAVWRAYNDLLPLFIVSLLFHFLTMKRRRRPHSDPTRSRQIRAYWVGSDSGRSCRSYIVGCAQLNVYMLLYTYLICVSYVIADWDSAAQMLTVLL